jgi:hypothetical protein
MMQTPAAVTSFCEGETRVGDPEDGKAYWTDADVDRMIQFLLDNKPAAGDRGNFKKATCTATASHLKDFTTKGAVKTVDACKSKWGRVSKVHLTTYDSYRSFFTVAGILQGCHNSQGFVRVRMG